MTRDNKFVFFALATWGFGEGLFFYLLPLYIEELGADPVQIGFTLSIASVVMTLSLIPSGWLADRMSRRKLMIIGWLLGTVAVLVLSMAQSWQQVIPGLLLYNLSAFNMPALNSYVVTSANTARQDLRGSYALVFAGFTLGIVPGPAVGGWLAGLVGLRSIFYLSAALFVVSSILIIMTREQPVSRAMPAGDALPLRRNQAFFVLCGLFFLAHLVGNMGIPLASNFLQDVHSVSMFWIGALGSAGGLGAAVLTVLLSRWIKGRRLSLLGAQLCLVLFAAIMLSTSLLPLFMVAFFLRGGFGAMRTLAAARLGELMSPGSMGLGFGIFQTIMNAAMAVSPYIVGWLYTADPYRPFLALLLLMPPIMLLTVLIGGQRSAPAPRPAVNPY